MLLSALAASLGVPAVETDVEVTGVTHNASWVKPGDAFVAIKGAKADGHAFVDQAISNGAVAVIGERPLTQIGGIGHDAKAPHAGTSEPMPATLPYLTVPNARAALADAAAALEGHPSRDLTVVGVTGTDGKTTTTWLLRYLLEAGGHKVGFLSTVGYALPDGELRDFPSHFTTPEAPQVQELLRQMANAGADTAVVEASSHALALERVRSIDWDVAVWTQLTSDHLDFHNTVEEYFATKKLLIERAPMAVLNLDDPWTSQLSGVAGSEATYGQDLPVVAPGAPALPDDVDTPQWHARNVREGAGISFTLDSPDGTFEVSLPMIGRYNVSNAVAAMAAAHQLNVPTDLMVEALRTFPGVPGRMQIVPTDQDVTVVVDFAHTTGALEKALRAMGGVSPTELWVVVGAVGGDRDTTKRAPMGEVASRLADQAVFTEDDPRTTPVDEIITAMLSGSATTGKDNVTVLPDRHDAIQYAITNAAPGAVVLLAGKGPEPMILREDREDPWNEVQEALDALQVRAAQASQ